MRRAHVPGGGRAVTAALCWSVIAVVPSGDGLGTCGHEHDTADEATMCPWTPEVWPETCDLLVREFRRDDGRERSRGRQLQLFGRPLRQRGRAA